METIAMPKTASPPATDIQDIQAVRRAWGFLLNQISNAIDSKRRDVAGSKATIEKQPEHEAAKKQLKLTELELAGFQSVEREIRERIQLLNSEVVDAKAAA